MKPMKWMFMLIYTIMSMIIMLSIIFFNFYKFNKIFSSKNNFKIFTNMNFKKNNLKFSW